MTKSMKASDSYSHFPKLVTTPGKSHLIPELVTPAPTFITGNDAKLEAPVLRGRRKTYGSIARASHTARAASISVTSSDLSKFVNNRRKLSSDGSEGRLSKDNIFSRIVKEKRSTPNSSRGDRSRLLNIETQVIAIELNSNWGSSDILRIAQIEVYDQFNARIPIIDINSHPSMGLNFKLLYDGWLDKDDINSVWAMDWPQEQTFTLLVFIDLSFVVSSVRLYNSKFEPFSSVKQITIKMGTEFEIPGEVPKSFVADFKLCEETKFQKFDSFKMIRDMFPSTEKLIPFSDEYGQYPFISSNSVTFEILSSRSTGGCGLNGIEIYDHELNPINYDRDINDLILHNCLLCNDPKLLFKENKRTDFEELMFQFIFSTEGGSFPTIKVEFKREITISKIVIWNYNSDGNTDVGVKKMIVRVGRRFVWGGIVKIATGIARGSLYNVTTIYLGDSGKFSNDDRNW
ncbi:hypothetical protein TRFO_38337 [Tritrichomonas foetus]|uniref:KATNIP domain-containing protein n=1 Tax=Tritrichomonas foetus TaxID=1144522 RepID=A0A1J4JDK8_9EUKA|nr:hypothetical protein TRFO_38337 [Tritrichomonas foetus]|eukprot:OHS95525.1 hypothetical protein TRFO_38337 [Tritrichomonas foetus]